jgi:hypothetical protein
MTWSYLYNFYIGTLNYTFELWFFYQFFYFFFSGGNVLCLCNILSQSSRIWPVYTIWQVWRKLSHERRFVALEFLYIICIWTLPIANIYIKSWVRVMVFKDTFNNISAISWRSVLLVEETGVPAENHRPVASHWQTLSHNVVSSIPRHEQGSNSQL